MTKQEKLHKYQEALEMYLKAVIHDRSELARVGFFNALNL